jgi:hypothetical protein
LLLLQKFGSLLWSEWNLGFLQLIFWGHQRLASRNFGCSCKKKKGCQTKRARSIAGAGVEASKGWSFCSRRESFCSSVFFGKGQWQACGLIMRRY